MKVYTENIEQQPEPTPEPVEPEQQPIDITIEVQDTDQLNKVIKAIRKVDSVYEVNRKKNT